MLKDYTYPQFFYELLDHASLVKSLPINKEIVQLFWDHVKKYSTDKEIIERAINRLIEEGDFLDPGNIIKRIPREYPEPKGWPTRKQVDKTNKSGIAKDCLEIIYAKMGDFGSLVKTGLSKEEYYQEMLRLEEKYPNIAPLSFKRCAEMYIQEKRLS